MWCLRQTLVLSLRHQVERALSSALSITGNHRGHAHLVPQTDIVTLSRVLASNYERERLGASDRHWCSLYLVPQREHQCLSEAPHCCSLYLVPQIDIVALSLAFSRALSLVLSLSRALISCARTHARAPSHTTGHAALAPPTKIFALPFSLSLSLSLALSLSRARAHFRSRANTRVCSFLPATTGHAALVPPTKVLAPCCTIT